MRTTLVSIAVLSSVCAYSSQAMANQFWSPDRQWLLGDWNGQRKKLEDNGYKFTVNLTNETATALDGAIDDNHQTRNTNQVMLGANFDLNKIADWKDTSATVTVIKRDGKDLKNDIGMQGSTNENHGRGNIWRISQAWIKTGFLNNTLQVKAGRINLSEDFNASHCQFQSLLLCGGQVGKSQGSVWYNSPVSGWALDAKYQITPEWSIATGVYENNPENLKSTGKYSKKNFNMDLSDARGIIIPIELGFKTKRLNGLNGEYKLGGFTTTEKYDKSNGNGKEAIRSVWINSQQQLTEHTDNTDRGLYMSANLVFNDNSQAIVEGTQQIVEGTQQLAFWYKGMFDARPQDQIGLGLARYQFYDNVPNRGDAETDFELNYTYNYSPAVMLRPNIQYINKPLGFSSRDDAWAAGISVGLKF